MLRFSFYLWDGEVVDWYDKTKSSCSIKHRQEQPEFSGPTPKSQRTKMGKSEDNDKKVTLFVSIQKIPPILTLTIQKAATPPHVWDYWN